MTDKDLGDLGVAAGDIISEAFHLGYETCRNQLIPAGGMALTSEQVEDVEALVATANPYSAPAARLRALFPATEPAAEVKPCGSNSVTLGWCKLAARHEGLHTNGTYLWGTPSEPDPPAPAEPAEEETKAEEKLVAHRDSKGDIYVGHALVAFKHRSYEQIRRWFNEAHPGGISERRYRAVLHLLNVEASSPVVPAPTETGPWQRIEDVPVGVPFKDREGSGLVKLADGQFGYVDNYRETSKTLAEFAPFVAAEEG